MTVVNVFVLTPEGRLASVVNPCSTACGVLTQIPDMSPGVILDLREVTFIDASGIGFIAALCRSAQGRGGELRLVANPGRVLKLLQMCGLPRILQIFEKEQDALASFVSGSDPKVFLEMAMVRMHGPWWHLVSLKPAWSKYTERMTV